MTPSQSSPSSSYYYPYNYPCTPAAAIMNMYPVGSAGGSPSDTTPHSIRGAFGPSTPTSTSSHPHVLPVPSSADAERASPSKYSYHQSQWNMTPAINRSPTSSSPLGSPLSSPHYYYAQYPAMVSQRHPDAVSSAAYPAAQGSHASSSHSVATSSAAPAGPAPASVPAVNTGTTSSAPYYGRQSRRFRRKSEEDVPYAMNYPSHAVPDHMYVPTGPPDANWKAVPPKPEDIRARKYATGVDERNFFTVLEYKINDQPIIWDYYTGYVHLTGIWKAIGHAKADIVKLLDNSPELEPVIKRVRGGFLKIQGTWVPFDVAHRLAKHICYYIRFALVPMFGTSFPDECTKPDEPGFGQLQLNQPYAQLVNVGGGGIRHPAGSANKASTSSSPQQAHALTHPQNSNKPVFPQGPLLASGRQSNRSSEGHASRDGSAREALKDASRGRRRGSGGSRTRTSSSSHQRSDSFNSIRRAIEKHRVKVDTSADTGIQNLVIDAVDEEVYDENVFEDDDPVGSISPPPMPRKLSFRDEERVSESPTEFIEMLKATRSLQQMSAGRRPTEHWNRTGGGFECAGRRFHWDGSDRLDVILDTPELSSIQMKAKGHSGASGKDRELTPPPHPEKRLPSLTKILNLS